MSLDVPVQRREIPDLAMVLELPCLPPSTNKLYIQGRIKTQQYRDWSERSALYLRRQVTGRMTGRVDIRVKLEDCHPTRDADNTLKAICDLLQHVGAIVNDNAKHVRSVKAEWANVKGVRIEIERVAA